MSASASDTWRFTVQAPSGLIELSAPMDVPLAELLPVIVQKGGDRLAEDSLEGDGFVLQRLGEPPLPEEKTPSALGLLDGETLYLRPRTEQIREVEFDDLVDGVAEGVRSPRASWNAGWTRRLFTGLGATAALVGLPVLLRDGPVAARAWAAAGVAVVLLAAAALLSRLWKDFANSVVFGCVAVLYAALAGALLGAGAGGSPLSAAALAPAGGAAAWAAFLGWLGVAGPGAVGRPEAPAGAPGAPVFAGMGATALGGFAFTLVREVFGFTPLASAALVGSVTAQFLWPYLPLIAFRMARMRLPELPTDAEQLQRNLDPIPGSRLLTQAAVVGRYLLALIIGLGVVYGSCAVYLAASDDSWAHWLAGVLSLSLVLRCRVLAGVGHRLATLVPTLPVLVVLLIGLGSGYGPYGPSGVAVALALLALAAAYGSHRLPGRRLLPYYGRTADILETVTALALPLLVLQVLGVFALALSVGHQG
ncbi:type VII secretion integral membrane protein EccD [Kitasatospora sp. NPDC093102]|uniref:type VII secretion integral membrane protein EccD n=1 Tax=Kitasatospora sp. NPDC093102 TaxID=3155069 RepID=UPI00343BFD6E